VSANLAGRCRTIRPVQNSPSLTVVESWLPTPISTVKFAVLRTIWFRATPDHLARGLFYWQVVHDQFMSATASLDAFEATIIGGKHVGNLAADEPGHFGRVLEIKRQQSRRDIWVIKGQKEHVSRPMG
jgi:hypothetical protein